jgi:hypothetical protein
MSDQPAPTPNAGPDLWEEVILLCRERQRIGLECYGTPLQTHNGRNPLRDALDEALDLSVYLHQHRREMQELGKELRAMEVELFEKGSHGTAERLREIIKRYPVLRGDA